jgi:predicted nucleotidyltransferase
MDEVLEQIKQLAIKYKVEKIVLFGSRARGDHSPVSDYDIAVYSQVMSSVDQACFWAEVEEINTLKKIDLLFMNGNIDVEMLKNIKRDGVIIYG